MHLFASHDWGVGGVNHKRVKEVVRLLRDAGHTVWFDENNMKGNILDDMCTGIDESDAVLVFVTRNYMQKVSSGDDMDNCRREFMYAQRRHGTSRMITIRFDPELPLKWWGPVGMILGERLYADLSLHDKHADNMDELFRLLPTYRAPPRGAVNNARNKHAHKAPPVPVLKKTPIAMRKAPVVDTIQYKEFNTRTRVDYLLKMAGMSEHAGEHTHEKLDRLFISIGLDTDKSVPLHVKVRQAERELGACNHM
jgi:hypothetical protein